MDGKSYLRERIIGPIELLEFCGYYIKSVKTTEEIANEIQQSVDKYN